MKSPIKTELKIEVYLTSAQNGIMISKENSVHTVLETKIGD